MPGPTIPRRALFEAALAALALGATPVRWAQAVPPEIKMPENVPVDRFDFETKGIEGWTSVQGQWGIEDMPAAPSGKRVLVQRAIRNEFNVIVAPPGPYTDVDVSVKFMPLSGKEDASGGIVFRFTDGKYYVVRVNALEDNFRLYTYDRGRRQIATATVKAPALKQWHTVRLAWPRATTCRPRSTASSTSTIGTPASSPVAWASGRRRTRSRPSTTSPFAA
jgi:hypothetical protein